MSYPLQQYGDDFEKKFYPYLHKGFPNYEVLWRRFIVPLTRREIDGSLQLKPGIDSLIEEMCMAHYSIYYHLGVAYERYNEPKLIYWEDVFFHLGTATEMVERFLFALAKIYEKVQKKDLLIRLTEEKYNKTVKYREVNYRNQFQKFQERGELTSVILHKMKEVIDRLCTELKSKEVDEARGDFYRLIEEIRKYRNTFTHNPRLARLLSVNRKEMIPKKEFLERYSLWSQVTGSTPPNLTDFTEVENLIVDYQTGLELAINTLWSHLIKLLDTLATTSQYQQMAKGEDQPSFPVPGTQPPSKPEFSPSSFSGTAASGMGQLPDKTNDL
jgi:hypothetical protein